MLLVNGHKLKFSICFPYLCWFLMYRLYGSDCFALPRFFLFFSPCSNSFLDNKKKKKGLVGIKKCKNLMMLQVFWILSRWVQLRESRLGIKLECAVGANQLVTEPHWVTESNTRAATWASSDSHHHHPTHGCPGPLTCVHCGTRWVKEHMLEI